MSKFTRVGSFYVALGSALLGLVVVTGATSITRANTTLTQQPGDGHNHGDGKKHDEHDGKKTDLGSKKIAGYDIQVTQVGDVKAGDEAIFIVKVSGGTGEPKAVRAWVGIESGQGSIKTKAEEEKEGEWHAHHKVSKPLPASPKLWVEIETSSGKKKDSFDVKVTS